MSLKAKIEAVIYAAEEPVTLAQIAALFQTELAEEREARLKAEAAILTENSDEVTAEEPSLPIEETVVQPEESPAASDDEGDGASAAAVSAEDAEKHAADEQKRAAKQREREARDEARRIIGKLIAEYTEGDRGIEIQEIAGGYRLATKPEYHDAVRGFVKSLKPPMKLSLQALETLAVIAYKQPVTAPEISEIRGVDSGGVLGSLVSRKLISTAGRKQVIGRPILYKTTKEFLLRFGLKDLNELPSMEEFEKMAGELAETEDATPGNELPFDGVEGEEPTAVDAVAVESEAEVEASAEEHAREGNE